jgi:hypothetical protein
MRFLLDTNILIPLEDSSVVLQPSLANFVRLATANGHALLYHPASEEDIAEDRNAARRQQTLRRLGQYVRLDAPPPCPWNEGVLSRNDRVDNEILYALHLHAAHGLITEDRGIHDKAKGRGLVDRVFTIQTAEDLLRRLHETTSVQLPNVEEVPLFTLTPLLPHSFFDSLREAYPGFNDWFQRKAEEGRRAWISKQDDGQLGAICVFTRQDDEQITDAVTLPGPALKLATFKVADTNRGRKIGELFLKAAFRYATLNNLPHIFIHGDREKHHFLFEMLQDFGFEEVGFDPGSFGRDAVFVKEHPVDPPAADRPPFAYLRAYFPHFVSDESVSKYVVPIRPQYHDVLFPDFETPQLPQRRLFAQPNSAGNAIKMAYLCRAQTATMSPGDILLFYRSADLQALTGIGVVESYETMADADSIAARVRRRTVYSLNEIVEMAVKPTRVMLFRFVRHLGEPIALRQLLRDRILNGPPQSITKLKDAQFQVLRPYLQ